jgi:hypothetical protein
MYMLTYLPNIVLELLLTSHGLACMASTPCLSWQIRRQALLWRWRALNGWSCKLGFMLRGLRSDVLCMHSWHFPLMDRIRDLWMISCLRGWMSIRQPLCSHWLSSPQLVVHPGVIQGESISCNSIVFLYPHKEHFIHYLQFSYMSKQVMMMDKVLGPRSFGEKESFKAGLWRVCIPTMMWSEDLILRKEASKFSQPNGWM